MTGPLIRTDIVDVYVFRRAARDVQWLQLHRCKGPIADTWQPVMGHVEDNETAVQAALRELSEEPSYALDRGLIAMWQLELVNTYFLAQRDCIMMSPCFAAEVVIDVEPVLDDTHDAARWVKQDNIDHAFMWPGQLSAIRHIARDILPADSSSAEHLRISLDQYA